MVDHTAYGLDICCHLSCILDWLFKMKINNVVSVVGDGDLISIRLVAGRRSHSEDGLASTARFEGGNFSHGVLVAERGDFDRNRESRSQSVAQLGFVNNDDEFVCHDLDHFFSKQSTATSLDKIQIRIDLIGSVNCNIPH